METGSVIAVTREGRGDWLLFDSFEEADEHPLVQYGDAIMTHETHFMTQFTRLELPTLMQLLDLGSLPLEDSILRQNSARIWARMVSRSRRPTSDPAEICELIRRDRVLTKQERNRRMTETPKTEKKKGPGSTGPKIMRDGKRKFDGDDVITFLTDPEGRKYGPDNNPKRTGSKAHASFALYRDGMTVDDFLKAGGPYTDIVWDEGKSFIAVKPKA